MITLHAPFARLLASVAVAAAGLLAAGCGGTALFHATRTAQVTHAAGSPVSIYSENGSVDLARAEVTDVHITAHIRAQTQERLDEARIAVVRDETGRLTIGVDWPGGHRRGNEGCDFDVRLPDASGVTVETSNGRIAMAGLAGAAMLGTSNGGIQVTGHDGDVRGHTSNGRVTMRSVRGEVKARTSNGAVEVVRVTGMVDAATSNGHVEVILDPAGRGPVFVDTSNGSISVDLGPAFSGKVTMRTSNGRISVIGAEATGGKEHKSVVVGAGGAESILKTSNGPVQLRIGS